jgi:hypothetical protein
MEVIWITSDMKLVELPGPKGGRVYLKSKINELETRRTKILRDLYTSIREFKNDYQPITEYYQRLTN